MTTTKNIKVTGIKKAMGNYNQCDNWNRYGLFYLDTVTGEVWCNVYNNCNTWTEYHDKNIINLNPWEYISTYGNEKLTMQLLKLACERAIKETA